MSWKMRQNQRKLASLEQSKANYTRAAGMLVAQHQISRQASLSPQGSQGQQNQLTQEPAANRSPAGSPKGQGGSQLEQGLVPNSDALSTFLKAGEVYDIKHAGKDTESHLTSNLTPYESHDAGMGFEGWYGNGQNDYGDGQSHFGRVDKVRNSSICGSNWAPNEEAEVYTSGWYAQGKGGGFSVPSINPGMRKLGSQHCLNDANTNHHTKSSVTFDGYGNNERNNPAIPANVGSPTNRKRLVERKKSLSVDTSSPYETSNDYMSNYLADHTHVRVSKFSSSPKDTRGANFCRPLEKQVAKPNAPPWAKMENGKVLASDYE